MKIIDCFTFYNELDILKFRLEYLYDVVDHFILVEAVLTHSGNPKPLFFEQNKHMFSKYLDKIVHIVVTDMPKETNTILFKKSKKHEFTILREVHQRMCITRGLDQLNLNNEDVLIISDCDEIIDKNTLKASTINQVFSLEQDLYYYNITLQQKDKWTQAKILDYKTYKLYNDPQKIRILQHLPLIHKGGWHFSYFGNLDFIINKIRNFCHSDWFEKLSNEEIKERVKSEKFLLDLNFIKLVKVPLNENKYLPEGYQSHLNFFLGC